MPKRSFTYQENSWFLIAFALLGGLLFLPPYFRGLFFPKEQLVTFIVALWAFFATWMWKTKQRELTFFRTPMDYFALGVVVCYFIAIFGAANYRLAVQGFVKISLFFLVYWIVGELSRREQWSRLLMGILYTTGVGVALAGLGAALGVLPINDGFVGNRIFSTLQYPNSLAVYLIAMSFIGFYFWAISNKWVQFAFVTGNYLLLMTFLGTNSRGGMLVAALMIPIFVIGLAREHRMWVFLSLLLTGGGMLVGSLRFIPSILAQNTGKAWVFLGLGLLIALAGQAILMISRQYLGERKTIFALAGLMGAVLVAGIILIAQREVIINQIINPNQFHIYRDAEAVMTADSDGWNRVDTASVANASLVARTGGYTVKPGETVTYSVEFKSPSGEWHPYLTGSRGVGEFTQINDTTWTITWTNEDEVNRGEQIYFRHSGEPHQEVEDTFYFRNPQAVIEGQVVSFWQKVLPRQLVERLQSINLETSSNQERIYWSGEALRLIKERPVFGYGGGGWEAAYRSNQSYNYSSTQVHNDWVQLGVETGVVGFVAWLGLWLLFLYEGFKLRMNNTGRLRSQVWAGMSGAMIIGGHAWIDFDLSLGAVSIALWFGFGLIRGMIPGKEIPIEKQLSRRQRKKQGVKVKSPAPLVVGAICLAFTMGTGSLIAGNSYGNQAVDAVQNGDGNIALEYFQKASTYDPFQASYNADAARLMVMNRELEEALVLGEKAAKQNSFNWQIHLNLAEIHWQSENLDESVEAAERAHSYAPLMQEANNSLARVYSLVGIRYLEDGNEDAAREIFTKLRAMPDGFENYFKQLPENVQNLWSNAKRLKVDPELALSLAMGEYFGGNFAEAVEYLEIALQNEHNQAETLVWLTVAKEQLGQLEEAATHFQAAIDIDENVAQNYYGIMSLPILKP